MQEQNEFAQFQGRLFNMSNQIEQMQWELARLVKESRQENAKMEALTSHIVRSEEQRQLNETLAEFRAQLDANQEKLSEFAGTLKKMNRTQFKANTLGESKERQTDEAIVLLRELIAKQEEKQTEAAQEEQETLRSLQADSRRELAADFLPVLDGIELALAHDIASQEEMGTALRTEPKDAKEAAPSLLKRFFPSSPPVEKTLHEERLRLLRELRDIHEAVKGWRQGLEIVRERFLRLFAAEGIEEIPDLTEVFDPHRHVAVEIEIRSDVPENTIVKVLRKGYKQHERILRYSEVIVAKAPKEE